MAWERSFEERVLKIRERELHWQRMTFLIQVCCLTSLWYDADDAQVTLNAIWSAKYSSISLILTRIRS